MAEAKKAANTNEPEVEAQAEDTATEVKAEAKTPEVDKYALKHVGFGKYEVDGQRFDNKAAAETYVAKQKAQDEFLNEHGDMLPDGYDMTITDRVAEYRGSLMELAMNELYAHDGEYSPYYDRQWVWGWSSNNGPSISSWQATGWKLVSLKELEELEKEGLVPPHVLSMVREEGSYLVYGDAVLMRKPRVLWRQQQEEKGKRSLRKLQARHNTDQSFYEQAGVSLDRLPVSNELTIRM
jgi:hypothetical protein